jgi:hypothetical protein
MSVLVHAVDRPAAAPVRMSDRFRTEVAYFMSTQDEPGVPQLGDHEYWIDSARVAVWLDEGVFRLVSPLDTATRAEIELSEEQESWLEWMQTHGIQHIRLQIVD